MKTINTAYGVVALLSFTASSVLSYLWALLGSAAYGAAALAAVGVFVWATATVIKQVTLRERATVTTVDFTPVHMNKAA